MPLSAGPALGTDGFNLELSGESSGKLCGDGSWCCSPVWTLLCGEAAKVPFPALGDSGRSHLLAFPHGSTWRERLNGAERKSLFKAHCYSSAIPDFCRALPHCSDPGICPLLVGTGLTSQGLQTHTDEDRVTSKDYPATKSLLNTSIPCPADILVAPSPLLPSCLKYFTFPLPGGGCALWKTRTLWTWNGSFWRQPPAPAVGNVLFVGM